MASTRILTAETTSDWDKAPVAQIAAVENGYRVTFAVGSWIDTQGKDTSPVFGSYEEAQAIAEKFGDALADIKNAAAQQIADLLAVLPSPKVVEVAPAVPSDIKG